MYKNVLAEYEFPWVKYLLALSSGVYDVTSAIDFCSMLGWIAQPHRQRLHEMFISKDTHQIFLFKSFA